MVVATEDQAVADHGSSHVKEVLANRIEEQIILEKRTKLF